MPSSSPRSRANVGQTTVVMNFMATATILFSYTGGVQAVRLNTHFKPTEVPEIESERDDDLQYDNIDHIRDMDLEEYHWARSGHCH